ncbi:hypothetical protein Glove_59g71 [Diversispora epigaea]|uniref:Uncharacterized protein n=1 Tax=Diversispora epigaea TaxID=1348612 RepID=A0A397JFB9_9GLOM|nr:hypothetical protein Glove_59g71 [Diversispora epigaea]
MLTQELPARVNEIFSTIINEEHAARILSRSDSRQISYSLTNNPYELQLILRGNKDGFAPITFWIFVMGTLIQLWSLKSKEQTKLLVGYGNLILFLRGFINL